MSRRYQAGFIRPGYNPLKVPNAPTIGTATDSKSGGSVSVAFTAPSCVGGGAITGYTAVANCGSKFASGSSSPITVTCLTNCTAYTFKVYANNSYGPSTYSASSNSVTPTKAVVGQQAYTTAGTYSWVAPACVTSISVVATGGGGGGAAGGHYGGGAGGSLTYRNNVSVTPGTGYTIVVGAGGLGGSSAYTNGTAGGNSTAFSMVASGGSEGTVSGGPAVSPSGTFTAGYSGGAGGSGSSSGGGGGSAAGYAANGAAGSAGAPSGTTGSGGSGGGGGYGGGGSCQGYGIVWGQGGSGGGVGLLGQGANGAGGASGSPGGPGQDGGPGSGGPGQPYGGGGGGGRRILYYCCCGPYNAFSAGLPGARGAVRIIWPGNTRQFPSTCTGDK